MGQHLQNYVFTNQVYGHSCRPKFISLYCEENNRLKSYKTKFCLWPERCDQTTSTWLLLYHNVIISTWKESDWQSQAHGIPRLKQSKKSLVDIIKQSCSCGFPDLEVMSIVNDNYCFLLSEILVICTVLFNKLCSTFIKQWWSHSGMLSKLFNISTINYSKL